MSRVAKIEVLHNFWDHLLFEINFKAVKKKDKQILGICTRIMKVPKAVKYEILKRFVY